MEWKRGPAIGRGSSAKVYLAGAGAGETFAVKSADLCSSVLLRNEERLMSQLSSPYVVNCLGSEVTVEGGKSVFNLFLEYVHGGTLSDLIRKQGGSLDEKWIQFYAYQIVQGLSYLHGEGIVHCDIKGQNIMIGDEGIKIIDFGCSKRAECSSGGGSAIAGTPAYLAPEAARGEEQGFAADVWGLGCTIIEMATGSNPWPEMRDPGSVLYRVAYSDDLPEFPDWFSGASRDFLGKCLMRDPNERWTATELLQHPFLCSVEENCGGENREITRKSPTSVMDQGFWDELEESESAANTSEVASSSSSSSSSSLNSPASRIGGLIGSEVNFPEWGEEEDWIRVRGTDAQEFFEIHHEAGDLYQREEGFAGISGSDDEQIQNSIATQDSSFNYLSNEISMFETFDEIEEDYVLLQMKNVQGMTVGNSSRSDQLLHSLPFSLRLRWVQLKQIMRDQIRELIKLKMITAIKTVVIFHFYIIMFYCIVNGPLHAKTTIKLQ